jgi:hypothetical protein
MYTILSRFDAVKEYKILKKKVKQLLFKLSISKGGTMPKDQT